MTAAEEREFIALWQQGLTTAAIAQQLGIPVGTVKSRAHTLAHAGKLTPRPRGGARQQGKAQPEDLPASPATPPVTFVAVPEIQELLGLVKDLHARVGALEQTRVPPALPAPPTTTAPPAADRKDIQQWTVRLSKALIEHIKAVAYERRLAPSQLVEEWLWQQAHDGRDVTGETR